MDQVQDFFNAVIHGDTAAVEAMIASQPDLVHRKSDGASALHFAALNGHRQIVDLLLDNGAELEVRDDQFNATPISWANEKGHMEIVRQLSDRGALVAIDKAAAFGMIDLVREYLDEGTEHLDTVGGWGAPLHEAALWGYPEIVELLLSHGADSSLTNVDGKTAFMIAREQVETGGKGTPIVFEGRRREILAGCSKVVEILKKRGVVR